MHSTPRRNTLGAVLGALLLVACGGGDPSPMSATETSSTTSDTSSTSSTTTTSDAVTADTTSATTSSDPCVAVRAIFFDLGDTLVEQAGGDLFVERPGASDTIAGLKALGMRVGIITNTPANYSLQDLKDLLENPGFLDEFEVVLLSSLAASPPKPDPAIFLEAHGLLTDAPPIERVAFVTENLAEVADQEAAPTQGARAAGMVGIHLSSAAPSALADYTFAPDQLTMLVTIAETEWLTCAGSL